MIFNIYTTETDNLLDNIYTKTETDNLLDNIYTKTEADHLLANIYTNRNRYFNKW